MILWTYRLRSPAEECEHFYARIHGTVSVLRNLSFYQCQLQLLLVPFHLSGCIPINAESVSHWTNVNKAHTFSRNLDPPNHSERLVFCKRLVQRGQGVEGYPFRWPLLRLRTYNRLADTGHPLGHWEHAQSSKPLRVQLILLLQLRTPQTNYISFFSKRRQRWLQNPERESLPISFTWPNGSAAPFL